MSTPTRVALVTGGSRGIGAAIVRALATDGYDVAFNHVGDATHAADVTAEVAALGRRVRSFECDVANSAAVDDMVRAVEEVFGLVHTLVCNAGITRDGVSWKMTDAQWNDVISVNLSGVFHFNRAVARSFRARGGGPGHIVNIASINGLRGKFGQVNYSASKGGIIALTKAMARELGRFGVTVNAVAPGMVMTAMAEQLPESVLATARAETVLGRLARPEDIADAVAFLCSARARHITGQCLQVDGGQYI